MSIFKVNQHTKLNKQQCYNSIIHKQYYLLFTTKYEAIMLCITANILSIVNHMCAFHVYYNTLFFISMQKIIALVLVLYRYRYCLLMLLPRL